MTHFTDPPPAAQDAAFPIEPEDFSLAYPAAYDAFCGVVDSVERLVEDPDGRRWFEAGGWETPIEPPAARKRKPTLAGIAKQAAKAGLAVARYDVRPDGTVSVVTGMPGEAPPGVDDAPLDCSEWN